MNTNLIPITTASIGGNQQQGVNARDLHAFLEVKTAFKDWIARRIEDFDFKEDSDFCSFLSKTPEGGRPSKEYLLTINMAKELSMVERNEKGKQARQYFIQCEKQLKEVAQQQFAIPQTYAEALRLAADKEEENQQLKSQIEQDKPRVEMAKRVIESDGAWITRKVAKVLGVTQTFLFDFMRQKKILTARNEPYASFVQSGVIRPKLNTYTDREGNEHTSITPYITTKGIEYLITRLIKEGILKDRSSVQYDLLQGAQA